MTSVTEKNQPLKINKRQVATLRNYGALCDIRRHSNGFLYGPFRVAVSEELLEQLGDSVLLQFTHLVTGDVWTCTVLDFRRMAEPIQFGNFEPQRAVEIARMNHTREGVSKGKKKRVNELLHIEQAPTKPEAMQLGLFR